MALLETKFDPTNVANPPVDRLSSREPAQSASAKVLRSVEEDLVKVIPTFKVSRTYPRMHLIAVQIL